MNIVEVLKNLLNEWLITDYILLVIFITTNVDCF